MISQEQIYEAFKREETVSTRNLGPFYSAVQHSGAVFKFNPTPICERCLAGCLLCFFQAFLQTKPASPATGSKVLFLTGKGDGRFGEAPRR